MHQRERKNRNDDKITFCTVRLRPDYFYALENVIIPYLVRNGNLPAEGAPVILVEKIVYQFTKQILTQIEEEKKARAGITKEQLEKENVFPVKETKEIKEIEQQQEEEIVIIDG
jgi:hypothetical protein